MRRAARFIALAAFASGCASSPAPAARSNAPRPAPDETARRGPEPPGDLTAVNDFGCVMDCHGGVPPALAAALRQRAHGAQGCFDDALRRNRALKGQLVLRLQITSDGFVCASAADDHGLGDAELKRCVLSLFRGQHFSAPSGGCVNVAFPLRFVPSKGDAGTGAAAAGRNGGAGTAAAGRDAGAK